MPGSHEALQTLFQIAAGVALIIGVAIGIWGALSRRRKREARRRRRRRR
jgi:ABC-type proline/glycine betaine transport system permease subunit